jgi:hypothetical protein
MLRNGIPRVCFYFFPRNGIPSIVLFCGTVRNGIPRVFCSAEWFRAEFREFASILVAWYRIPSILLLCGMVRNGIPRVLCYAEHPEFRRNKPVYSVFREILFFCQKLPTLVSANEFVQLCTSYVTWSPNKLWRSTSIFNLWWPPYLRHRHRRRRRARVCRRRRPVDHRRHHRWVCRNQPAGHPFSQQGESAEGGR